MRTMTMLIIALFLSQTAVAQFSDNGQVNSEYDRTDGGFSTWASHVISLERGYQDYRHAFFKFRKKLIELGLGDGIDAGGGFVEKQ